VPAKGTVCQQEVPFQAPEPAAARSGSPDDMTPLLRAIRAHASPVIPALGG
jgi:hypothetical protein